MIPHQLALRRHPRSGTKRLLHPFPKLDNVVLLGTATGWLRALTLHLLATVCGELGLFMLKRPSKGAAKAYATLSHLLVGASAEHNGALI